MPLDPYLTARLTLLDGIDSWSALDDPVLAPRVTEWSRDGSPYPGPAVASHDVGLTADGRAFRVRVYGSGDGAAPCVVWVHGGAFLAGDLDMNEADLVARELVDRAGAVVVSVDYELVPHVRYPVPHRQVVAAVRWAVAHAAELGADPDRLVLGGASAGGALGLAAARELVAAPGPVPRALLLAYPVGHHRWPQDPRQEALMAGLPGILRFSAETIVEINDGYVAGHPDPRFAFVDLDPAGVTAALTGLPPTLVVVCEYDDLRTSAELLVEQARAAGCRVERRLATGMVHGHLDRTPVLPEVDASLDALARVVRELDVRPEG
ncbi:MAG TPA: alpha/beta hydrolase [Actinotalea sp.]|nr:alpha/beta hydrolase [Actinotalea sp.]